MKIISTVLIAWLSVINYATGQNLYLCKNAKVSLFSSAPIEDIKATTTSGVSVFNSSTNELDFTIIINTFHFDKSLMQEHFNENYMESDKYPRATFKGKVQENLDITKDGTFAITVVGDLNVHNVTEKRTLTGTMTIKNGTISMASEFMVKCADHHIEIPQLVFHNIAESIKMNVSATYILYKSPLSK